jgi:hypothetical protein
MYGELLDGLARLWIDCKEQVGEFVGVVFLIL